MVSNAHVLSASSPDLRDIITRQASGVPEINLYVIHPPSPDWLEATPGLPHQSGYTADDARWKAVHLQMTHTWLSQCLSSRGHHCTAKPGIC